MCRLQWIGSCSAIPSASRRNLHKRQMEQECQSALPLRDLPNSLSSLKACDDSSVSQRSLCRDMIGAQAGQCHWLLIRIGAFWFVPHSSTDGHWNGQPASQDQPWHAQPPPASIGFTPASTPSELRPCVMPLAQSTVWRFFGHRTRHPSVWCVAPVSGPFVSLPSHPARAHFAPAADGIDHMPWDSAPVRK